MCEGTPRSSKGTKGWYQGQEDQMTEEEKRRAQEGKRPWWRGPDDPGPWQGPSGWHSSVGARLLLSGRLGAWFRWVFVELERHQEGCRWRRLATVAARR